jgi:hypothetical protein
MTTSQIITKVGVPISYLGPWRHAEKNRHKRFINTLKSFESLPPWRYITFPEWTRAQANVLCYYLNEEQWYGRWHVLNHPKYKYIVYYEPALLSSRGPDSFEVPVTTYYYPFKKCILAGNWFKTRSANVKVNITYHNGPKHIYRYALDPVHGHIIYRAL